AHDGRAQGDKVQAGGVIDSSGDIDGSLVAGMQILAHKARIVHVATHGDLRFLRGIKRHIVHASGDGDLNRVWVAEFGRGGSIIRMEESPGLAVSGTAVPLL